MAFWSLNSKRFTKPAPPRKNSLKLELETFEDRFQLGETVGMTSLGMLSSDWLFPGAIRARQSLITPHRIPSRTADRTGAIPHHTEYLSLLPKSKAAPLASGGSVSRRTPDLQAEKIGLETFSRPAILSGLSSGAADALVALAQLHRPGGEVIGTSSSGVARFQLSSYDLGSVSSMLGKLSSNVGGTSSAPPLASESNTPFVKTVKPPVERPESGVSVIHAPGGVAKFFGDPSLPVVSVTTLDGSATEPGDATPGDNATFRISRTGSTANPLNVMMEPHGTAYQYNDPNTTENDVDYAFDQNQHRSIKDPVRAIRFTIAAGDTYLDINAIPNADCRHENTESIVFHILPLPVYNIGANDAVADLFNVDRSCVPPEDFVLNVTPGIADPGTCLTPTFDGNNSVCVGVNVSTDQECACGATLNQRLTFNSEVQQPHNILQATLSNFMTGATVPSSVTLAVSWDGGSPSSTSFSLTGVDISKPVVLAIATTGLSTGRHVYKVTATTKNGGGTTLGSKEYSRETFVVNTDDGVLANGNVYGGDGWTLGLTDRLIDIPKDATNGYSHGKLLWSGNGTFRFYLDNGNGVYTNNGPDRGYISTSGTTLIYTSPLGVRQVFNSSGYQTNWVSADGAKTVTFTYDGSNRIQTTKWYDGTNSTFTYTGGNLLDKIVSQYAPATNSGLGSTSTGALATYTFGYTSSQLSSLQMPDGRTWTYTYNGSGQLVESRIGTSAGSGLNVNSYRYDGNGLLDVIRVGNKDSDTSGLNSYTFDAQMGRGLGAYYNATPSGILIDPLGRVTTFQFDKRGYPTLQNNPDGGVFTYTRDGSTSDLLQHTEPGPSGPLTTTYQYDPSNGFVSRIDYPDGTNEQFTYTEIAVTNGVYGVNRNVLTNYTNTVGAQTAYQYDAVGHPSVITEDSGGINAVTTLTWSVQSAGQTTNPGTTAYGNLLTLQDPRGNWTTYSYDTRGRLQTVRDPIGTFTYDYDDKGNQGRILDRLGIASTFIYDSLHRVTNTQHADPDGAGSLSQWRGTFTYDDAGQLKSMQDPLSATTDRTVTYSYDSRGLSIGLSELYFNGASTSTLRQTTNTYDSAGQLTSTVDPRGNTTQFGYDNVGRLTTMTYAASLGTVVATYSQNHWLASLTDARGYQTTYAYTGRGWLQSATEQGAAGTTDDQITSYFYSFDLTNKQLKVGVTDPRNNTSTVVYDALNRMVSTTSPDPDGGSGLQSIVTTYTYDAVGNLTQVTHPRTIPGPTHVISTFTYDAVNRLVDQTIAANTTDEKQRTTYAYDAGDRLTGTTESVNTAATLRTTTYAYDNLHRLTGLTESTNVANTLRQTSYSYDAASRLVDVTFVANSTTYLQRTTMAYDALDRMTGITEGQNAAGNSALTRTSAYVYDANDNVVNVTDPVGRLSTFSYDARNRLTQITQPDPDAGGALNSPLTTYAYDGNSNVTSVRDPRNNQTQYAYDPFNRLQQVTSADPDGGGGLSSSLTTYSYDKSGNLVSVRDPLNNITTYNYDNLNRTISIVRPDPDGVGGTASSVTQFDYEQAGTLLALIESPGLGVQNITTYTYDGLDRVKTESKLVQLTSGTTTTAVGTFSYDTLGRLQSKVTANNETLTYTYDALDRMTQEIWKNSGGTTLQTITYTYDLRNNLIDVNEGSGNVRTTFSYDALDRVSETRQFIPAASGSALTTLVTSYSYYADDQVQARTSKIDTTVDNVTTYTYDGIGRLTDVKQTLNPSGTGNKQAVFTYLPTGEIQTIQRKGGSSFANAALTTYSYDNMGRTTNISTIQGTFTYQYTYAYDAASRISREDNPSGVVTYSYYANNEISGADYNYRADESFTWDENGNPTGGSIVIGKGNRLISDGTSTYEYDAEGNRTKKTTGSTVATYTWDQRNRLTGATKKVSGITNKLVTVTYDAFNRRIAEYAGDGTTVSRRDRFWMDGNSSQGILNNTTVSDRFLMGPGIDNVIANEKAGTVNWTLTDIRGSVQQVLDSTGKNITQKDYSAFGVKTDTGNPSVTDSVFAYTGREYDPDLGLQYSRSRWYDANIQRFVNEDVINYAGGDANLYRNVGNDPVNNIDPWGTEVFPVNTQTGKGPPLHGIPVMLPMFSGMFWVSRFQPNPEFAQKIRDARAREARERTTFPSACELGIAATADVAGEGLKAAGENLNRIGGVAQAGFGAVEAYVAAPLLVLAPPLGAAIMLHAMDNFYHGVESAITNRHSPTYTERGISQGLQRAGLSKGAADFLGGIGNGLIGAGATAAAAKLREAWLGMQGQTQGKGLKGLICDEGAASPVGPRIPPDVIASEHLGPGHFLNHGDPNKWKFLGRKPVPATGRGFDKGTKKVYDVYLDENGCQVEMHYWQKLDGTIFGERFEQAGSTTIP